MRVFSRIARDAKAWLDAAPRDETLAELEARSRSATDQVPESRRADWEKLLSGFGAEEDAKKRRARVEGLMRACRLFDRDERDRERRAQPLAWDDPVERVDGVGPTSREKLAACGVSVAADLVWTLPVGWDDLRAPVGVAEAIACAAEAEATLSPAPRQCVRGIVKSASAVPMRGRRAVRVVLADAADAKAAIEAWWFFMAHGVLATARAGVPCLVVGRVRVRAGKRPIAAHPDLLRDEPAVRGIRPRYASLGMTPGMLRRAVGAIVAAVFLLRRCGPACCLVDRLTRRHARVEVRLRGLWLRRRGGSRSIRLRLQRLCRRRLGLCGLLLLRCRLFGRWRLWRRCWNRRSGAPHGLQLLQRLLVQGRMPRLGYPILVGKRLRVLRLDVLQRIRRQTQVGHLLLLPVGQHIERAHDLRPV